jgi:hypothetical protein
MFIRSWPTFTRGFEGCHEPDAEKGLLEVHLILFALLERSLEV